MEFKLVYSILIILLINKCMAIDSPPTNLLAPFSVIKENNTRSSVIQSETNPLNPTSQYGNGGSQQQLPQQLQSARVNYQRPLQSPTTLSTPGIISNQPKTNFNRNEHLAKTLSYKYTNDGLGSYSYNYDTDNGIKVSEVGQLKPLDDNPSVLVENVHGSYSYIAPDGTPITVNYVANENGFQPSGSHLPTPPPIPDAIARSIKYILAHQ